MKRLDWTAGACIIAIGVYALPAIGADPQPYQVELKKTGNALLDQALSDSSSLITLRETAAVGPFALVARAQRDVTRFSAALDSFGYYQAKIQIRIASRPLEDPELIDLITRAPVNPPVRVGVNFETGPLFHLRKVDIEGEYPDYLRDKLGVTPGMPAVAADVLAGRDRMLSALRDESHALAKVEEPEAFLIPDALALDVVYKVQAGPKVELGQISFSGLDGVNEEFLRRRLLIAYGDPFNPAAIEAARRDLTKTGVFSSVSINTASELDAQGRLPVRVDVAERPRHATTIGAAYSTDVGGSLTSTWQHRNVLGNAEQLNLTAAVTQIGGNSTTGIGYKGIIGFVKPDFFVRDQSIQTNLSALKQSFDAYDQKSISLDGILTRKFWEHWSISGGLAFEQSQITQENETHNYTFLSVPLTLKFDNTDSLLDPTSGLRTALNITPFQPLAGAKTDVFGLAQATGSTYFDLLEPGRSILALRATLGDALGAGQFDLPPDKRFYAGGSATVRGYRFQSIGPLFANNKPMGGTTLAAATVEFRQRIFEDYGAVAFADIGQVGTGWNPFEGPFRLGLGAGLRYYTAFGPIRLDVALPVQKIPGSGSFEAYIGLGQAF